MRGNMENEEYRIPRNLQNIVTGPYPFELKNGVKLALDEWTIGAEKWAKANYGSMQELYNRLMRIGVDDDECIDAVVDVIAFNMTDHSKEVVEQNRGEHSVQNWLRKNLTYKLFAEVCKQAYQMIVDSIPVDVDRS